MNRYSKKSRSELDTCVVDLQLVFETVLRNYDHSILEGRRDALLQDKYFTLGRSKLNWPNGKHNVLKQEDLSRAVVVAPYPILWPKDAEGPKDKAERTYRFYYFAGYVLGTARMMGIKLRWGGDWNRDKIFKEDFKDLIHFEVDE